MNRSGDGSRLIVPRRSGRASSGPAAEARGRIGRHAYERPRRVLRQDVVHDDGVVLFRVDRAALRLRRAVEPSDAQAPRLSVCDHFSVEAVVRARVRATVRALSDLEVRLGATSSDRRAVAAQLEGEVIDGLRRLFSSRQTFEVDEIPRAVRSPRSRRCRRQRRLRSSRTSRPFILQLDGAAAGDEGTARYSDRQADPPQHSRYRSKGHAAVASDFRLTPTRRLVGAISWPWPLLLALLRTRGARRRACFRHRAPTCRHMLLERN